MLELPPDITYYAMILAFFGFSAFLAQLIFRPAMDTLNQRRHRTVGAQAEAEQMQADAEVVRRRLGDALEQARQSGGVAGDTKRRDAEAGERELIEQARVDAAAILSDVRSSVASATETARLALRQDAPRLASQAAEKILGRPVAE